MIIFFVTVFILFFQILPDAAVFYKGVFPTFGSPCITDDLEKSLIFESKVCCKRKSEPPRRAWNEFNEITDDRSRPEASREQHSRTTQGQTRSKANTATSRTKNSLKDTQWKRNFIQHDKISQNVLPTYFLHIGNDLQCSLN